jgi:hypothetical protein
MHLIMTHFVASRRESFRKAQTNGAIDGRRPMELLSRPVGNCWGVGPRLHAAALLTPNEDR